MTLVAGISCGTIPAFLGDLLVSWRLKREVSLPTQPAPGLHPGVDGDFAAGLAQKLIIVRPYLLVCWAGSASEVFNFITELDRALPAAAGDLIHSKEILLDPLSNLSSNVEITCLLKFGGMIYPISMNTQGYELYNKRIYTLGTGSSSFLEFLEHDHASHNLIDEPDGRLSRAILIKFVARSLMSQFAAGHGLAESWGGGFEIVYPCKSGFKKIDGIFVRAWKFGEDGILAHSPVFFLLHYEGLNLCITSISDDTITTSVPSWLMRETVIPKKQTIKPLWIIDLWIDQVTGVAYETAMNYRYKRDSSAHFDFVNGCIKSWDMDYEYVNKISKMIIDNEMKIPGFMTNYPWKYIP